MSQDSKALIRRYYAEAVGDLSGIAEVVAPDFVDHHMPPGLPPGPEGVRTFFREILGGVFSDMRIDIDFMLAEGDKVACYFALIARHTSDFGDIPAKGLPIRCPAVSTFRVADGKLAEAWEIYDSGDLFAQMRGEQ